MVLATLTGTARARSVLSAVTSKAPSSPSDSATTCACPARMIRFAASRHCGSFASGKPVNSRSS